MFKGRTHENLLAMPKDKCVLVVCHHCDGSSEERGNPRRGSVVVLEGFSEELRQVLTEMGKIGRGVGLGRKILSCFGHTEFEEHVQ